MGDESDNAPTQAAPTELSRAIDETEANTAWSLDDAEDWPPPRFTPRRIVTIAVICSFLVITAAGVTAIAYLRPASEDTPSQAAPSSAPPSPLFTSPAPPPPPAATAPVATAPPVDTVTVTAAPAPAESGPPMASGVQVGTACNGEPQFGYTVTQQVASCTYPGIWRPVVMWSGVQPYGGPCGDYSGAAMTSTGEPMLCVQGAWEYG